MRDENRGAEVIGLLHGGISVSDMDASLAFYRDGLGLPLEVDAIRDTPYLHEALDLPFSEIRYVLLAIPGAPGRYVELLEYRGIETMPAAARPCDPGSGHICLQVRDAVAAHARMTALGYRARSAGAVAIDSGINAGGKLVYFADPDGFWVELLERPAAVEASSNVEHLPMTTLRDDLAGLDGPVRSLFERIAGPAAGEPPDLEAIAAALVELAGDRDYIGRWVTTLGETSGGLAIHAPERGPRLMIVHRGEGQIGRRPRPCDVGRHHPDRRARDTSAIPRRRRRQRPVAGRSRRSPLPPTF